MSITAETTRPSFAADAKVSFAQMLDKARTPAPAVESFSQAEPPSAPPSQEKVFASLETAASTAQRKGNESLASALSGVKEALQNGTAQEMREAILTASDANKEKPDFMATRALLGARRLAHDAAGQEAGIIPPKHEKAQGSDEVVIADALKRATEKYGVPSAPAQEGVAVQSNLPSPAKQRAAQLS